MDILNFDFETVDNGNQAPVLGLLLPIQPEQRSLLAVRPGPGWHWWYGSPGASEPDGSDRWNFSGLHSAARWVTPLTPHPDAPMATSGNAGMSLWLPVSVTAITSVAFDAAGNQRFWRVTMDLALNARIEHVKYLATMSLGEAVRVLLACLGLRQEREVGTGQDIKRYGMLGVGVRTPKS